MIVGGILVSVLVEALHRARRRAYEREEVYSAIVNQAADAIVLIDAETLRFVEFNDAACTGLGYSRHEFSRLSVPAIQPAGESEETAANLTDRLRRGGEYFETQFQCKEGKFLYMWVSSMPVTIRRRQFLAAVWRDVTERKKAVKAMRSSEQELRSLFAAMTDVVLVLDHDGRYVKIAPTNPVNLYRPSEALLGKTVHDILPKEEADAIVHQIRRALNSDRTINFEYKLNIRSREVWFDGKISPLTENTVFWIARDISERKSAEAAVRDSEERYRTIADLSPTGIFVNVDGYFAYANSSFARIMGFDSPESMVGKTVLDYFDPAYHGTINERIRFMLETGKSVPRLEEKLVRTDGTPVDVEVAAAPIFFQEQRGILVVVLDITDRKRAEEALRESEKRYRTLFDESVDGIYVASREGTLLDANQAFLSILQYDRENLVGKDIRSIYVNPSDRDRFVQTIDASGALKDYPLLLKRSDGKEVDCLLTAHVRRGDNGSILGYEGILRDITEQKNLQRQLLQAQKMEAIGTLAGGVAHDFNNLLTIVMGFSELLLAEKQEDDREYEDLRKMFQAARSGAELVQRLLMFSRKSEPRPAPMNLNKQIVQVEKLLRRTIPRMVDIHVDLSADLPDINADASQIEQVLVNLAVNARDAMPNGGELTVRTSTVILDEEYCRLHVEASPGEYVVLEVSDTGYGMDKETIEHIFEPFFTTKERGRGTGLGLSIVYGIAKQHHGHITVYSEVGKGTVFRVYLPAIPGETKSVVETSGIMPAFGSETILLVDDEDFVRELGARILTKHGYTVLQAVNGKEALDHFEQEHSRISLVILDLIMPAMGGTECLKGLLKIDPKVKVLVASGYSADSSVRKTLQSGAKGFVTKPYRVKELLRDIRRVLDEG